MMGVEGTEPPVASVKPAQLPHFLEFLPSASLAPSLWLLGLLPEETACIASLSEVLLPRRSLQGRALVGSLHGEHTESIHFGGRRKGNV